MSRPLDVCFFAPVDDVRKLTHVGFYSQDIQAIRGLGHRISLATRWRDVPWDADVYFVWWWTWAFIPLIKAKLRRRPVVITGTFNLRWGQGDYFHRSWWQRLLLRACLRLADENLFVSHHELDPIAEYGWTRHASYSPHCVDTNLYSMGSRREPLRLATVCWLRMENAERKGMVHIIQALPDMLTEHPTLRLAIVGEWDTGYRYLRTLAQQLGVSANIDWLGKVDEAEKIQLLQSCTLYLQPSKYEGFGLAILEAMSCGAPLVTRSVGAVPEVVGDVAEFVDETSESLSNAVKVLLSDENRRGAMGVAGRARAVENFALTRRVSDIDAVLKDVVARAAKVTDTTS